MAIKEGKDTVLSLYVDILEEIKDNKEYSESNEGKKKLKKAELQVRNILMQFKDAPEGEAESYVKPLRNEISMLKGEDYYFTVSDGFETYALSTEEIGEMKDQTTAYVLNRFKEGAMRGEEEAMKNEKYSQDYKNKLENAFGRLVRNIDRNISLVDSKGEYEHEDKYDNIINDTEYPIFQDVVGTTIMINI